MGGSGVRGGVGQRLSVGLEGGTAGGEHREGDMGVSP